MNAKMVARVLLVSLAFLFGVVILMWGFLWVQLLAHFPPEQVYFSATSPNGMEIAHFSVKYRGIHPWFPTDIEPYCYLTVVGTRHGEVLVRETEHHGTIKSTFAELAKKHAPWAADPIQAPLFKESLECASYVQVRRHYDRQLQSNTIRSATWIKALQ